MKPGHVRRSSHGHYPHVTSPRHSNSLNTGSHVSGPAKAVNGSGSGSGSTSSVYGTAVRKRSHRHRRKESKDLHDDVDAARVSGVAGGSEDLYVRVDNADDFWTGKLKMSVGRQGQ